MTRLPHISRAESVVLGVYTPSTSRLHSPTTLIRHRCTLHKSTMRHHSLSLRSQDMARRGRMSTASHHILQPLVSLVEDTSTQHRLRTAETNRLSIAKIRLSKEIHLPDQRSTSMSRGTSISSKAAMAGVSASAYGITPRFVLHTDGGTMDEVVQEVVELPPTYNDVSRGTAPNTPTTTTQDQSPTTSAYSYSGSASGVDAQSHPLAPSPILSNQK
jgi:hypothetical protein